MTSPTHPSTETVLISGASIAGPTLAYWLHRYGFEVTIVEKARTPRGGGYPIDVRGTAIEVVRRMGVLPRLQAANLHIERFTFVDADGVTVASLPPHEVTGSVVSQDLEMGRGDLTAALYAAVRDDVEFLFDDSIDTFEERDDGVDVEFRSGSRRRFDLVIGADGMHSRTRRLQFGAEEQFHRYLGYAFGVFTMPNTLGLSHELTLWNTPGRAAALYATGSSEDVLHAFVNFHRSEPPRGLHGDRDAQRALISEIYAQAGWEIPAILRAMQDAEDLFFDTAGQIRMPSWSKGRVALVGDAAYAPSFLTGQGSSLAIVGAYMLAASLGGNQDHAAAFRAYERDTWDFVTRNQALVDTGGAPLFPITASALEQRNTALRGQVAMPPSAGEPAHSALTLPVEIS